MKERLAQSGFGWHTGCFSLGVANMIRGEASVSPSFFGIECCCHRV